MSVSKFEVWIEHPESEKDDVWETLYEAVNLVEKEGVSIIDCTYRRPSKMPETEKEFVAFLKTLDPSECSSVIKSVYKQGWVNTMQEAKELLEKYGTFSEDPNYEPGIT